MFGKRRPPGSGGPGPGREEPQLQDEGEAEPDTRGEGRNETRVPASPAPTRNRPGHEPARRPLDQLVARRQDPRGGGDPSSGSGRKLVVGRGIRLSGEIKKCETLVVEGHIEADLNDCASLEINDSGEFQGAAVVEAAEISGYFEGNLTVKGRLLLRASGLVRGTIRYADLEIERGGRIAGDVDIIGSAAADHGRDSSSADRDDAQDDYDADDEEEATAQAVAGDKPGALI